VKTLQSSCGEKLVCSICERPIDDKDYITFIESELVICARCAFEGMEEKSGTA